jgi:hypothetical protein
MRLFILSIAMVAGFVASAWAAGCGVASRVEVRCDYSWDAAKYDPDEAKVFGAGSAVKLCPDNGVMKPILFASAPLRGAYGVCYFWVRDMTKAVAPSAFPERSLYMRPARDPCPRQDAAGYIENENMPDGVFAELMSEWNSGTLMFPPPAPNGIDFAALLKTAKGQARFSVWLAESTNWRPHADAEAPSGHASGFVLEVSDSEDPSGFYDIDIDWSNGAFRVTGITGTISGC